jgi:rSAM/selenodomain-associated transferase 1
MLCASVARLRGDRGLKEVLVLMAKAPREGEVKTRLIGALSPAEATELYINFLRDTFALMEEVRDERETLALALCYTPEGEEEAFEIVEREGSLMLAQRGADLGERLSNCFIDFFDQGFDSVVVIGADSPTLPADYLFSAFDGLADEYDVVIGPAEDDGYYLVGMRKFDREIFEGIPWGTPGVLSATKDRVRDAGLNLNLLPAWYDVDTPAELARLKEELISGKATAKFTNRLLAKYHSI